MYLSSEQTLHWFVELYGSKESTLFSLIAITAITSTCKKLYLTMRIPILTNQYN